jgi:NMD protein affecting ribosome stability and mRNA decay
MKDNSRHAEYYEAILQIRPKRNDVLDYVVQVIEAKPKVTISKIKEFKHGYDIYISDQRFARGALAQQLRRKYKGSKVIITKTLYGVDRMSSRLLYRASISVRLEDSKE